MIHGQDLMPNNWVLNMDGKPHQVKHLEEALSVEGTEAMERWMVNGDPEELWSPIPLTPELMEKIGWLMKDDNAGFRLYAGPESTWALVRHAEPLEGTARFTDPTFQFPDRTIQVCRYLHELQNMYRWEVGKHLEVSL